jgi:hypothetical protein
MHINKLTQHTIFSDHQWFMLVCNDIHINHGWCHISNANNLEVIYILHAKLLYNVGGWTDEISVPIQVWHQHDIHRAYK